MRHKVFGKKLNRNRNQRKALFRSLIISLVKHGKIETTEAKAKAVRPLVEKIISKVKKNNLSARRQVLQIIPNKDIVKKLFNEIGPLFKDINSGFIRIIKTGERDGDNAKTVLIKWSREKENILEKKDSLKKQKNN